MYNVLHETAGVCDTRLSGNMQPKSPHVTLGVAKVIVTMRTVRCAHALCILSHYSSRRVKRPGLLQLARVEKLRY